MVMQTQGATRFHYTNYGAGAAVLVARWREDDQHLPDNQHITSPRFVDQGQWHELVLV